MYHLHNNQPSHNHYNVSLNSSVYCLSIHCWKLRSMGSVGVELVLICQMSSGTSYCEWETLPDQAQLNRHFGQENQTATPTTSLMLIIYQVVSLRKCWKPIEISCFYLIKSLMLQIGCIHLIWNNSANKMQLCHNELYTITTKIIIHNLRTIISLSVEVYNSSFILKSNCQLEI